MLGFYLGSVPSNSDILFYIYNDTNGTSNDPIFSTVLNSNSDYYFSGNNSFDYLIYVRNLPYFNQVSGNIYRFTLVCQDLNQNYYHINYTLTMSWSSSVQDIINDNISQDTNSGITSIDNFLNNQNYNQNSIIEALPSSNGYENPTEQSFNSIFTAFYNAFTTTTTNTVRFYFPNSNGQYIDISADLVTSKIPTVILTLIQSFYWFVICRYIIKDIAKTVHKARSGEILEGSDDGNIKTEIL